MKPARCRCGAILQFEDITEEFVCFCTKVIRLHTLGALINLCGRSFLKFLQPLDLDGEVNVFIQQVCRLCGYAEFVRHAALTQITRMGPQYL